MKKLVGLLALTLAISGVAYSDQDVIKSIKVTSEVRQGWQDKDGDKANGIGNAGFKKITEQEQDGEMQYPEI